MAGIGDLAKGAAARLTAKAGTDKEGKPREVRVDPAVAKAIFEELVGLVSKGETVSVQGLGNFKQVDRKATKARNPKTGASFDVGPSKRLKFTASKTLREHLNTPAAKAA